MSVALVTITGPIAAGKNTVASALAERCTADGHTVVIADVDDVAAMVAGDGAGASGLWFAAHQAHGVVVAQWLRSGADVVISVGPYYTQEERDALEDPLPEDVRPLRVVVDAPLSVTWARVSADARRGRSRERDFHTAAHARFRSLLPGIPVDLSFDSSELSAADIAADIHSALGPDLVGPVVVAEQEGALVGGDRDESVG